LITIKQRKDRAFDTLESVGDVIELFRTKFKDRKLHLKYYINGTEVQINEYLDDKSIMIVTDPGVKPENDELTIYGLLDKYIEIDLSVINVQGPGYFKCGIKSIRRAKRGRRDLRFKISPDEAVATNFKVSKHTIDISSFKMPTSIKVLMDQFQSNNSKLGDIVKVDVLDQSDAVQNLIKKTGKILYIEDVSNRESYRSVNEDFLDLTEDLKDDLDMYLNQNVVRGYKSIIISPLKYGAEGEKPIPFGYIQVISKSEHFTSEKVELISDMTEQLIERIRDSNTILISVSQQIVDMSKGGAKLKITDENLKKYLSISNGFIFDIVFKLQAPITIYGDIKFYNTDESGNLYIGVDFAGNSSRKDEMKRYFSFIKPLEVDYKNKLLKEMKRKKEH
jgi:hypothetical protein